MHLLLLLMICSTTWGQPAYSKMSTMVRQAAKERYKDKVRVPRSHQHGERWMTAFVQITNEQVLNDYGCRKLTQLDDIAIVAIPLQQLEELARQPEVLRIEAGERAQCLMDTVPLICNVPPIYQGTQLPQAFTGKNVVVGLMDIGFDLTSPNFYSNDQGTYRIKAFWDMLSKDTIGSPFPVGRDYIGQEAILGHEHSVDGLTETHGTHTLGIAAGCGYDTNYRGMAYESDICLVSNAVSNDIIYIDSADYYKFTTATDALGFKYLFDYANQQGKPCVASFSEGYTAYLDEDDRLYAEFLKRLTGPGRIICVAAGNENRERTYALKPVNTAAAGAFIRSYRTNALYRVKSNGPMRLCIHAYANGQTPSHTLSVLSSDGRLDSLLTDTLFLGNDTCTVAISRYPSASNKSETIFLLQLNANRTLDLLPPMALVAEGTISKVEFFGSGSSALTNNDIDSRWNSAEYGHNILAPALFPAVICVGGTTHRLGFTNQQGQYIDYSDVQQQGKRMRASSTGPAMNGLMKPDITAPGFNVISSMNSFYMENKPSNWYIQNTISQSEFEGHVYHWAIESGTSMSCPAVAGIIALWLQACPTLTQQDVIDVFSRTSRYPEATLTYPNNQYGYGEIDAYRGLLDILGATAIQGLSSHTPSAATILPAEDGIRIHFDKCPDAPIQVSVYSLSGTQICKRQLTAESATVTISLPSLPSGVYAVQLSSESHCYTGSQLVRL
jgi:subtilisin family serine protease